MFGERDMGGVPPLITTQALERFGVYKAAWPAASARVGIGNRCYQEEARDDPGER